MDQNLNIQVFLEDVTELGDAIMQEKEVKVEGGYVEGGNYVDGGYVDGGIPGEMTGATTKDPLLASWPFVIGVSSATLIVSIIFGILLAKKKIKKGYELYED